MYLSVKLALSLAQIHYKWWLLAYKNGLSICKSVEVSTLIVYEYQFATYLLIYIVQCGVNLKSNACIV